jgi:hypothetical protein
MQALEYGPSKKQLIRDLAIALAAVVFCAWLINPDYFQSLIMNVEPPSPQQVDPGLRRILAIVLFGIFSARALQLTARLVRPYPTLTADVAGLTFHMGRKITLLVEWNNVTAVESRRHNKQLFLRLRVLAISLAPSVIKDWPRPSLLNRSFSDDFRADGGQVLLLAHNITPAIDGIQTEIEIRRNAVTAPEAAIEAIPDIAE